MDGFRARLALLVGTVAMAAAAVGAPVAQGAAGDAILDSCLNPGPAQAPCTSAGGLTQPFPEALSPDGRQLYVASAGGTPTGGSAEEPTLLIFDRDPATGVLTRRQALGCVTPSGSSGACVAASNLSYPQDIAVSPDGHNVYVSNYGTSSIIEFQRATDGSLTLMSQCQANTGPCNVPVGMETPFALGFSPDGTTLYARTGGNGGQGTLLAFARAADGTLTQLAAPEGCWSELAQANCRTATGISDQGTQIAVTDSNVYVTGHDDSYYYYTSGCGFVCVNSVPASGTIAIFGRHADGSLTQAPAPNGCIGDSGADGGALFSPPPPPNCLNGSDGLYQARSVTVSPDGKSVYVGADNAIVAYSRAASGELTEIGCVQKEGVSYPGCVTATGIEAVYRMAVSPSGDELVSDIFNNNGGLVFMSRDPATGAIAELEGTRGCISSSDYGGKCQTLPAFGREGSIAFSSDSHFIYATANENGMLATVHRDRAPTCDARTVSVPYQTSVAVPLTCTDPDGDPLTMSIVHQPTAGSLGGGGTIDTGNDTVRYNPPLGYTGPDSFEYAAVGRGVQSPPVRVQLNIQPQAGPPAPTPKLKAGVRALWKVHGARFLLRSLRLAKMPAGWSARMLCKGHGCPFKSKQAGGKSTDLALSLRKAHFRHFHAGQRLTVELTAPGYQPETVTFALKKGKRPKPVIR
jgi:DNA-binding beta-propeller fold protein YncE